MREILFKGTWMTFLFAVAGLLPCRVEAQLLDKPAVPAPLSKDGPRISFSETVFNFGKVGASEPLRHDFIATNTGNAVLEISQVQPGCGCTTAGEWDHKIEPGKTGKIPIQFNPGNFSGAVTKYVTVTCNDPTQGSHSLQIQATIFRPIEVQPQYVYFMPTEGEETNDTKIVKITNNLEQPVTLQAPESGNAAFKTELKTIKEGKEFELHVSYSYSAAASNPVPNTPITVKTSNTNMPVITVTSYAMPQPAIVAYPTQVQLPPINGMVAGAKAAVTLRINSRMPTKLEEATVNSKEVKVQTAENALAKIFTVNLDFPPNFQMPANQPLQLTLKTSNPKRPVITVPIVQPTPPPPTPTASPIVPVPAVPTKKG